MCKAKTAETVLCTEGFVVIVRCVLLLLQGWSVEGLGLTPFCTPPNASKHKLVDSVLTSPILVLNVLLVCLAWPSLRYALCCRVGIVVMCAKSKSLRP